MAENHNPKSGANFFSLLTFWWMEKIMRKGSVTALGEDDLFPLLDEEKSRGLAEKLERAWLEEVARCRRKGRRPRLWRCLLRLISWQQYLAVATLKVLQGAGFILLPVMLWFFLKSLASSSTIDYNSVFFWVAGICLTSTVMSISMAHWIFLTFVWGIRWKVATIGLVYKKVIAIKRSALEQVISGNTINLVSNDARRLEEAAVYLVSALATPAEAIIPVFLLWYLIGWEAVAGSSIMLLVVLYIVVMTPRAAQLRRKAAAVTDQRLSVVNEIIPGIRTVKMYAWEDKFHNFIQGLRKKEIGHIRSKGAILSSFYALYNSCSNLAALIAVVLLLSSGKPLSASAVFGMLSLLDVIKLSVCVGAAEGVLYVVDAYVGLHRIETFLLESEGAIAKETEPGECGLHRGSTEPLSVHYRGKKYAPDDAQHENELLLGSESTTEPSKGSGLSNSSVCGERQLYLSLDKVCCSWSEEKEGYTLKNVSLNISGDKLVVVTGPVGSGKSSLLMAVLGELPISSGEMASSSSIAYVSQIPWVFSGTFRENVLFGRELDERKYESVLDACDLVKDVNNFPKGDLTQIGERGVSLSGGQRARVSLARAAYAEADIYLLDDPLSAVDAKVGKHLLEECICGMLSSRLRILTTHQVQYLSVADHVVILRDGEIAQQGKYAEIKDEALTSIQSYSRASDDHVEGGRGGSSDKAFQDLEEEEEDKMTGSVSWRFYWAYLRAGLPAALVVGLCLLVVSVQVSVMSPYLWLSHVIEMSREQQKDASTIAIYGVLVGGSLLISICGAFSVFYATLGSSEKLHDKMSTAVIRAPVLFFDTNPSGRIANRFSKDIGCMDDLLPTCALHAQHYILLSVVGLLLPSIANPWLLLALVPFIVIASIVTRHYLKSSRELKRLEAVRCSPVYSHISATVRGLEVIHCSNMEADFLERFYSYQDNNTRALYLVHAGITWFSIRLDMLCSLFVTAVTVAAVLNSQSPAIAGLSVTYALQSIGILMYGFMEFGQVENYMTSVERVMTYSKLEPEHGYHVTTQPPDTWPQQGAIRVEDMSLRYVEGGATVLRGLSFSIQAKEKVGVAGRTGAGKSSMVAALFRMPQPTGSILIDGVDTASLSVQSVRRAMAVITQDPLLFGGSLRKNLDPFSQFSDADLWTALEEVQLKGLVEKLPGQLEFQVRESGSNFSVGERQLLCLARALLQRSKILIMDEATANVDYKTDRLIQQVIRQKFGDCTVLTIAHRVNTIIDYDKVLVLDDGGVVEFDKPEALLAKHDGFLARSVQTHESRDDSD